MNLRMAGIVAVLVASAIVGGVAIGSRSRENSAVQPSTAAAPAGEAASPIAKPADTSLSAGAAAASKPDDVARYLAMRDDPNAIPRLAFIENAARSGTSPATTDLLAQAMVDADERVRSRAQALFDQRLVAVDDARRP